MESSDSVHMKMSEMGIPTRVYYQLPLNRRKAVGDSEVKLPVGDLIASQALSLPMNPYLGLAGQERVVHALQHALER